MLEDEDCVGVGEGREKEEEEECRVLATEPCLAWWSGELTRKDPFQIIDATDLRRELGD